MPSANIEAKPVRPYFPNGRTDEVRAALGSCLGVQAGDSVTTALCNLIKDSDPNSINGMIAGDKVIPDVLLQRLVTSSDGPLKLVEWRPRGLVGRPPLNTATVQTFREGTDAFRRVFNIALEMVNLHGAQRVSLEAICWSGQHSDDLYADVNGAGIEMKVLKAHWSNDTGKGSGVPPLADESRYRLYERRKMLLRERKPGAGSGALKFYAYHNWLPHFRAMRCKVGDEGEALAMGPFQKMDGAPDVQGKKPVIIRGHNRPAIVVTRSDPNYSAFDEQFSSEFRMLMDKSGPTLGQEPVPVMTISGTVAVESDHLKEARRLYHASQAGDA